MDTYAIGQGTVSNVNSANPNYAITFETANFTITQATVTVTPDTGQSKQFGSNESTLTYTADPDITLTGDLARDSGETVGEYNITQGTLTNTTNYAITFTEGVKFQITTRAITVEPVEQTIDYGDALPTNEYRITSGTLVGSDAISGVTYTYSTTPPVNADSYSITPSNAVFSTGDINNYDITYTAANLVIEPKNIAVSVADATTPFGVEATFDTGAATLVAPDVFGAATLTFTGIDGTIYGPLQTPPTEVGTYTVVTSALQLDPGATTNYAPQYGSGTLTITPASAIGITPQRGSYLGDTFFTITGSGFGPGGSTPTVTFGGVDATEVQWVNATTITGKTPPFTLAEEYEAEIVDVVVTVDGSEPTTLFGAYTYLPPRPTPTVVTLFPEQGPTVGNTEVTITGDNLAGTDDSTPVVYVNNAESTDVVVSDDGTLLTARTPPGPRGAPRDVELFTNEGAFAFFSAFTYIPPEITRVSPNRDYVVGGRTTVITGTGFGTDLPVVTIGGKPAQVVTHSSTEITVIVPAGTVGTFDVTVSPPADPTGVTKADAFGYVAVPVGKVSGLIWLDLDKNGVYNPPAEPVFPAVPLTLTVIESSLPPLDDAPNLQALVNPAVTGGGTAALDGQLSYTASTDANGRYNFSDLPYGRYRLTYQLPGDIVSTYEPDGARDGVLEVLIDAPERIADAGGVGGMSVSARLTNSENTRLPNADVILRWYGGDGVLGTPDDVLIPARSDANGMIVFVGNLPFGEYRVERLNRDGYRLIGNTLTLNKSDESGRRFVLWGSDVLPATGSSSTNWLLINAALLVMAGGVLVASSAAVRRRCPA